MIRRQVLSILTGLATIVIFSILGTSTATATPQARAQSLGSLAATGKAAAGGYGILIDAAQCDNNTPIRVAPRFDAQQLGVCQSSHIIGIFCYTTDASGHAWGLIRDFNVRMSNGQLLTGYGDGDHIYVLRLPPHC